MESLEYLILNNNEILELRANLSLLRNLVKLDLSHNELNILPEWFKELSFLNNSFESKPLNLIGNSMDIPIEIFDQSPEEIINFISYSGAKSYLKEVKLLLLGEGNVGKTSIVNRLSNSGFNEGSLMTRGIDISKLYIDDIQLNIWDFGGQEILHSMHQFFLTERSIYLFVWNARENDHNDKIEDWLKLIQSYGGVSPIIFVVNKIDDGNFLPDKKYFINKYKSITSYVRVSCKTGEGIPNLQKAISEAINSLEHLNNKIPITWVNLKNEIASMNTDYLSLHKYYSMCDTGFIYTKLSKNSLLKLLHDLGICLNYGNSSEFLSTNVLNPEWVTRGIYSILNSSILFNTKGRLTVDVLNLILDEKEFPTEIHFLFIDIMELFELCFPDYNKKGDFLIPDLLSKDEPYFDFKEDNILSYKIEYEYLPKSIFPRYIVRTNRIANFEHVYWRRGMLHKGKNIKLVVRQDTKDRAITLTGSGEDRKDVINGIKLFINILYEINSSIPNLKYTIYVSIPGSSKLYTPFDHLKLLHSKGIRSFIPEGLKFPIDVVYTLTNAIGELESTEINKSEESNMFYFEHLLRTKTSEIEVFNENKKLLDLEAREFRLKRNSYTKIAIILVVFIPYGFIIFKYWSLMEPLLYVLAAFVTLIGIPLLNNLINQIFEKSKFGKWRTKKLERYEEKMKEKIYKRNNFDNVAYGLLKKDINRIKNQLEKYEDKMNIKSE